MVRRWSYVNLLNRTSVNAFKIFACFGSEVIFKETTVFRKYKTMCSIIRRKSWGRRRHLHQWTLYIRILFDWSRDYNFSKKYSSWLFKKTLLSNSFITYNFFFLLPKSSGFYPGLENINTLTISRSVITFLQKTTQFYPFIWNFIKNSSTLYVTTTQPPLTFTKNNTLLPPLIFPVASNTITPLLGKKQPNPLAIINLFCLSASLNQLSALYKILLLVIFSQNLIKKNYFVS